ncbi:hypothetical protein [Zavarzinella formosa]|uniref:hypothetical protein n=1 Tax=Zavarzinella formosa TaxID=360055 RepID=UPI0003145086|nr:hypothetical protein [Zavarzinella formosa]
MAFFAGVLFVVVCVLGIAAYFREKTWLRETVIPRLEEAGYNPVTAQRLLIGLNSQEETLSESMQTMISKAGTIRSILRRQGKWNELLKRHEMRK